MKFFFAALILTGFLAGVLSFKGPEKTEVVFHQKIMEGVNQTPVDLNINAADTDEVFRHVFSSLAEDIVIYPSSNYYYFKFVSAGKEFWGNLGFSPPYRDKEVVNFLYYEFAETPAENRFIREKQYGRADGVLIQSKAPLEYSVTYRGKTVIVNIYSLEQNPPRLFALKEGETFIERTLDESGYQFFLIFNTVGNYFLWVLNQEAVIPDVLKVFGDLAVGKKSEFAFYNDGARQILIGVSGRNLRENNYYDGPHDQLADNFAEESRASDYIQLAYPRSRGKIDKYGWFTDGGAGRLAIAPYYVYSSMEELQRTLEECRNKDFYICITNNQNRD